MTDTDAAPDAGVPDGGASDAGGRWRTPDPDAAWRSPDAVVPDTAAALVWSPPDKSSPDAAVTDAGSTDELPSSGAAGFGSTVGFGPTSAVPRLTYAPPGQPVEPYRPGGAGDQFDDDGYAPPTGGDETRHPFDPDPVPSTKAAAVLALGVAALITGPLIGGLLPASVGLLLARQAGGEIAASQGYLTGAHQIRLGRTLCWVGIGLAVVATVVASVIGIISLADGSTTDFPDSSD